MDNQENNVQKFTTLLGFSLPLIQFFYGLLSKNVATIFLFGDYFLLVSVFTAVTAYISILFFKANPWFFWTPLQSKRRRRWAEWQAFTDKNVFTSEQIAEYMNKHSQPRSLNTIQAQNISQKLFLPLIVLSFVVFYYIGLRYGVMAKFTLTTTSSVVISLIQVLCYSLFVTLVVLAFALQYLRDSKTKKDHEVVSGRFQKIIDLARKHNAFNEYHTVSLIAYRAIQDSNFMHAYLAKVGEKFYIVAADNDLDTIDIVLEYESEAEAKQEFAGGGDA